ncbi:MAG: hypothetical protein P8X70_03410, partial [Nanoarchaeota archaeon]
AEAAKEAGAYIVATGRGDFPNQVNNSVGFPGILKGALLVRARKVSDKIPLMLDTKGPEIRTCASEEGIYVKKRRFNKNRRES